MARPDSQSSSPTANDWASGTEKSFSFPQSVEYSDHESPDELELSDHHSTKSLSGHNHLSEDLVSPLINLSVDDAESHRSRSSYTDQLYTTHQLPDFNIEQHSDPKIPWQMYYDFIVTKTGTYHQLQQGYIATQEYPNVIPGKIAVNGNRLHQCLVLGCVAKPFSRHYDLERHFSTMHRGNERQAVGDRDQSEKGRLKCDYRKCFGSEPLRKDHCREHYREYHCEDLIKKPHLKSFNSKPGKKKSETVEEFLAIRARYLNPRWWRCAKCLHRVELTAHAYICPTCRLACERERVVFREDALKAVPGDPEFIDSIPTSIEFAI